MCCYIHWERWKRKRETNGGSIYGKVIHLETATDVIIHALTCCPDCVEPLSLRTVIQLLSQLYRSVISQGCLSSICYHNRIEPSFPRAVIHPKPLYPKVVIYPWSHRAIIPENGEYVGHSLARRGSGVNVDYPSDNLAEGLQLRLERKPYKYEICRSQLGLGFPAWLGEGAVEM